MKPMVTVTTHATAAPGDLVVYCAGAKYRIATVHEVEGADGFVSRAVSQAGHVFSIGGPRNISAANRFRVPVADIVAAAGVREFADAVELRAFLRPFVVMDATQKRMYAEDDAAQAVVS